VTTETDTLLCMGMLRRQWLTVIGLVAAVVGGFALAWARTEQFGWTSYAPLQSGKPTAPNVLVFDQRQALIGLLLLVAGVGITGAGVGRSMARRQTSATSPDEVS
jgi:heme/copper-type cytochrome/quinol oxidase subunit 1